MDKIIIKNAKFGCNIGVSKKEKKKKQEIIFDIELFLSIKKASDDINHTVNYSKVCKSIKKLTNKKEFNLIETIAEETAKMILENFDIKKVLVRVKKPKALKEFRADYACVEIARKKSG